MPVVRARVGGSIGDGEVGSRSAAGPPAGLVCAGEMAESAGVVEVAFREGEAERLKEGVGVEMIAAAARYRC